MPLVKARDLDDTQPLTVRLGETDAEEPLLLYRVPLENGKDRVLIRPHEGRSWIYLVSN